MMAATAISVKAKRALRRTKARPTVRQRAKATLASVLNVTCDRGGSQLDGGLGNVQLLDSPESAMARRKMGTRRARGNSFFLCFNAHFNVFIFWNAVVVSSRVLVRGL